MPLSCKILVKIGPVDSVENIVIVVQCIFFRISLDVLDQFLQSFHHIKAIYRAIYVAMIDLYLFFQFIKGGCHGDQTILPKWWQTDTTCILCTFARWWHGFVSLLLARGDNAVLSGLFARLYHAFLVWNQNSDPSIRFGTPVCQLGDDCQISAESQPHTLCYAMLSICHLVSHTDVFTIIIS